MSFAKYEREEEAARMSAARAEMLQASAAADVLSARAALGAYPAGFQQAAAVLAAEREFAAAVKAAAEARASVKAAALSADREWLSAIA